MSSNALHTIQNQGALQFPFLDTVPEYFIISRLQMDYWPELVIHGNFWTRKIWQYFIATLPDMQNFLLPIFCIIYICSVHGFFGDLKATNTKQCWAHDAAHLNKLIRICHFSELAIMTLPSVHAYTLYRWPLSIGNNV